MCTLAVSTRQRPDLPLVVAANRDEALDRPSVPPLLWPGEVPFVAPRDEKAGGSWLGLTATGMFVGITNRYRAPRDPGRRSRGELVLEALRLGSVEAVHRHLAGLDPGRFNAFHLLYADRERACVSWSDGAGITQLELPPGLHALSERSFGGGGEAREARLRAAWEGLGPSPALERYAEVLKLHGRLNPFDGTCVHAPLFNYGTRSSAVLGLYAEPGRARLLWAEGRPCESAYVEQAGLLERVGMRG